jgi:hypothetical protein
MGDNPLTKILLVIVGGLTGIITTLIASAYKSHLDRKGELWKTREQIRHDYLDPLRVASKDLRQCFERTFKRVISERDISPENLKENYNLRYWFRRCKNYIVDSNDRWTDEERRRDFAMHSGGMGCEAASTLYIAACYLYHATRIRLKSPYVLLGRDDQELIASIDDVRAKFSQLAFYSVTQDSTGVSMRNAEGQMKNYREFGETITSGAEKAWFLTLTDVFFKLHNEKAENADALLASLDRLIKFLDQSLPAKG